MDSYNSYTSNSSSSASYNSYSSSSSQYGPEIKSRTTPPPRPAAFRSALHSVRKFPAKNIITKKPIAPLPPTPAKIYHVDPANFRDVVQKLTGAPELQPTRLQEVAPPPLSLISPPHRPTQFRPCNSFVDALMAENEEEKPQKSFESTSGGLSPLGFNLSPSALAWCSSVLFSPGTLASLEPSVVL